MSDLLNLFIPITKIDVEKRLVYGIATAQTKDSAGEVCDYATTKPHYEKWSEDVAKASEGKSLGNLRAMHGNIAAGKVTAITFNDPDQQIEICAKVVDDGEWLKVEEGVYTGFSQGGKYVKRWKDPDDGLQHYTAQPYEVSLVDVPCLPTATFQVIKADGALEKRHFTSIEKDSTAMPTNDQIAARARELAKAAGDETAWASHIEAATADLTKAAEPPVVIPPVAVVGETDAPVAEVAKTVTVETPVVDPRAEVEQVWLAKDGKTFKLKADAVTHAADLVKAGSPAKPLDDALASLDIALGKVAAPAPVAPPVVKTAMADGTLDITDEATLTASLVVYNVMKGGKYSAGRHIAKRATALKLTDKLPEGFIAKAAAPEGAVLAKGVSLYTISNLISLLASLDYAEESFEMDSYWDDSPTATPELKTRFGALLVEFGDIVAEALDIILNAMSDEETTEALARTVTIRGLVKTRSWSYLAANPEDLAKVIADVAPKPLADTLAKGADDMAKVLADNADLTKSMGLAIAALNEAAEGLKKRDDQIATLTTDVEAMKKMAVPGGPVQLQVASKEDDSLAAVTKAVEAGDLSAAATEMIKASQRRPLTGVPGTDLMHGTGVAKTAPAPAPSPVVAAV